MVSKQLGVIGFLMMVFIAFLVAPKFIDPIFQLATSAIPDPVHLLIVEVAFAVIGVYGAYKVLSKII